MNSFASKGIIANAQFMKRALEHSDAALIVTDWEEFNSISREDLKMMNNTLLLDGRRMDYYIDPETREGITWP